MLYGLKISISESRELASTGHDPIFIKTIVSDKTKVTNKEIEMVANAFSMQLDQLIKLMLK